MSSTLKHLRSSTASKRPTASGLADGQIGINTASGTPALFFKDSNGGVVKVGPAHVGSTAPNAVPAGSAGNSLGELWVNDGTTIPGLNYYTGSAFVNLTPSGTTAVAGLVELATDAETQTGTDTVRAVTPSGLQSKISDSTSTTSSTTIASATAVKAAYDLADAALPKTGGRVTGNLEIGPAGSLSFEGSSDDSFETTLAVVNPTADRTITFPNVTGTVVTTGDSGTVTSTMILDGTIVNADINASAGIVDTKLATIATAGKVSNSATTATSTNTNSAIVARDASGNFSAGTITAALTGAASANVLKAGDTMTGVLAVTAGTAALPAITPSGDPNTGIYSPGADQLAISTNGTGRLFVDANGNVGMGVSSIGNIAGRSQLVIGGAGGGLIDLSYDTTATEGRIFVNDGELLLRAAQSDGVLIFQTGGNTERARIDSSGTLLVGTSTISEARTLHLQGNSVSTTQGAILGLARGETTPANGLALGVLRFSDSGHVTAAAIEALRDGGTWTSGSSQPTRLVFSTTADGASSPTERMRITSSGNVAIGSFNPLVPLDIRTEQGTLNLSAGSDPLVNLNILNPDTTAGTGPTVAFSSYYSSTNTGPLATIAVERAQGSGSGSNALANDIIIRQAQTASPSLIERMRIDSSGRLLIGTSTARSNLSISPTPLVQIESTGTDASLSITRSSANNAQPRFAFAKSRSASVGGNTIVSNNDGLGEILFSGNDGTNFITGAAIAAQVDGTPDANDMPGRLVFSTTADGASSPTERMRIIQNGNIHIGFTTESTGNHNGVLLGPNDQRIFSRTTTLTVNQIRFANGNGTVGSIATSGSATAYNTSSDYRLKENVVPLTGAIDRLQQIPVHRFNFIADPDTVVDGFIAHEAQEVVPECVTGTKDEVDEDGNPVYQGIDQSKLVPLLTAALQEAIAEIASLKDRVAALEAS